MEWLMKLSEFSGFIGLDLVFSGLSGFSVFKGTELIAHGLLNKKTLNTSDPQFKINHANYLAVRLNQLFGMVSNTICIIEKSDWHQSGGVQKSVRTKSGRWVTKTVHAESAGRERRALQSLALARGLAISLILASDGRILPYYMAVDEVRGALLCGKNSKEAVFHKIKKLYGLDLELSTENMNVTDAIALPSAFLKVLTLPDGNTRKVRQTAQLTRSKAAVKLFMQALLDMGLGGYQEMLALYNPEKENKLSHLRSLLAKHNRKAFVKPYSGGDFTGDIYISVDVSSRNPAVVVSRKQEGSPHEILFHKTYALKNDMPDMKDISYEILTAANLLLLMGSTRVMFPYKGVIFDYLDTHRSGAGLDYHIDLIAINSLFFMYGVLLGGAYLWGLPVLAVKTTDAKKAVLRKKNASEKEIKEYFEEKFPFLKNEHTRGAALLAEYFWKLA